MAEILHQLIGGLSHSLQGFIHPRWLFGIFSVHQQYERWYSAEGSRVSDFQKPPGPWEVQKKSPPPFGVKSSSFQTLLSENNMCACGFQLGVWHPAATERPLSINPRDRDMERKKTELKQQETQPLQINKTNSSKTQPSLNAASKFSSSDACLRKHVKSDKYYDCWSVWDSHGGL